MEPITKEQLKFIRSEVNRVYLFILGKSDIDPVVIELMKLSALAETNRRYRLKEPWRFISRVVLCVVISYYDHKPFNFLITDSTKFVNIRSKNLLDVQLVSQIKRADPSIWFRTFNFLKAAFSRPFV